MEVEDRWSALEEWWCKVSHSASSPHLHPWFFAWWIRPPMPSVFPAAPGRRASGTGVVPGGKVVLGELPKAAQGQVMGRQFRALLSRGEGGWVEAAES